jgi:uncharacterized damage-inducible protein DinB
MIKRLASSLLTLVLCTPVAVQGQTVTESLQGLYGITKTNIMETARILDEDLYAYRPTDEVRSAGEILAHVADAQYTFCSAAAGEDSPQSESLEETRTTKAGIIDALKSAFAYCDGVYAGMTDEEGARTLQFMGPSTALGVLAFNSGHNYEHYGNLVTYMRLNGIVPPSSR